MGIIVVCVLIKILMLLQDQYDEYFSCMGTDQNNSCYKIHMMSTLVVCVLMFIE